MEGEYRKYLPVDSLFNVERSCSAKDFYGFGQLSVFYHLSNIRYNSTTIEPIDNKSNKSSTAFPLALIQREDAMSSSGLDMRSCLQFLQDLYSQWLLPETPLTLLTETVRSILMISDLFSERSHFQWMLRHFQEIQKVHPPEDEGLANLLRVGICKCVAVLAVYDQDLMERLKKSIETGLKAASLPTRMGCLHGLLYLAQCDMTEISSEVSSQFLPLACDYLQTYLQHATTPHVGQSEDHVALMWAMAFHIIENHKEVMMASATSATSNDQQTENETSGGDAGPIKKSWCQNVISLAISSASKATETTNNNKTSQGIYLVILTGLERLVIERIPDERLHNKILKLTTDLLTEPNPVIFIPAVQLFLACMYSNKAADDPGATATVLSGDPEQLMQAMEQMSILFDCVRRSGPDEAKLLCEILPKVLVDFFPAADVMNRVINEFISPGQPHQVLLAGVLFSVFQQAAAQEQTLMVQQWVLSMALPTFTKRSPVSHSMWCLSVFFLAASSNNPHLQAMFAHLQQRFGCYAHEDKRLFCLAARHFYSSLGEDEASKSHFMQTIKSVATPRTPYFDLLKAL